MQYRVTQIEHVGGSRVRLRFEHGSTVVVDLSQLVHKGGLYRLFGLPAYVRFGRISDAGTAVAWPMSVDIAADSLWERREIAQLSPVIGDAESRTPPHESRAL